MAKKNAYVTGGTASRTVRSDPNSTKYPSARAMPQSGKVKLGGNRRGSGAANLAGTTNVRQKRGR